MNYKVIYRRYASLYFIMGVDSDEQVNYNLKMRICLERISLFGIYP